MEQHTTTSNAVDWDGSDVLKEWMTWNIKNITGNEDEWKKTQTGHAYKE